MKTFSKENLCFVGSVFKFLTSSRLQFSNMALQNPGGLKKSQANPPTRAQKASLPLSHQGDLS